MNETVEDILCEMRDGVVANDWYEKTLKEFADRLDAAYMRSLKAKAAACESDIRRAMDEVAKLREENERLKAALKPVLDIHLTQDDKTLNVYDSRLDAAVSVRAVREAQRIYNGGAK